MKTRAAFLLASAAAIAVSASIAGSAGAVMVAGWDFSQYFAPGLLTTNGSTFANTLPANYSNFDPSFGAGTASAGFGTMYISGAFGSTSVPVGTGSEQFFPTGGSLLSNLDAGALTGESFEAFTVLASEGQTFTSALAMTATGSVDVVFKADLTGVPVDGKSWSVSFGGKTFSGTSTVGIAFSSNGTSYTSFGSVNLTDVDTRFKVALATAVSDIGYVRLSLSPAGGQPIIDNVAIEATVSVCNDGVDNDGDGVTDLADSGCLNTSDNSELKDCDDGLDNDNDGQVDWNGGLASEPADSFCGGDRTKTREKKKNACGLGFELALLMPVLLQVRQLRRRG